MRKIIFTIILSLVMASSALAADNTTEWKGLGVRFGIDVNCPSKWYIDNEAFKMFKPGGGFYLGAVYAIPLGYNFYFEPGAMLYYDTYRYDDLTISNNDGIPVQTSPTIKKFGARIPLVIGNRFTLTDKLGLTLATGPETSYSFVGKLDINKHLDWGTGWHPGSDLFSDYGQRRYDVAWKIGAGLTYNNYVFAIDAAFGIIDQYKGSPSFHDNRVSISLGYNF